MWAALLSQSLLLDTHQIKSTLCWSVEASFYAHVLSFRLYEVHRKFKCALRSSECSALPSIWSTRLMTACVCMHVCVRVCVCMCVCEELVQFFYAQCLVWMIELTVINSQSLYGATSATCLLVQWELLCEVHVFDCGEAIICFVSMFEVRFVPCLVTLLCFWRSLCGPGSMCGSVWTLQSFKCQMSSNQPFRAGS